MQGVIQLVASYIFGHHMFKYSNTYYSQKYCS